MKRSGRFRTNLSGELSYTSFLPSSLPPDPPIKVDNEMIQLLVKANSNVSVLNELSNRIPNMKLFVSMYVRKEALMSSQIEGTQATLEDIFDPYRSENVNRDVMDVVNYVNATEFAIHQLKELPLCNRLLKETHSVLMDGVRGQEKSPGEFRITQNWIGGRNCLLKDARYIPPNPEDMMDAMSNLETYFHSDDNLDVLIKSALIHYQFETIHPFLDGNGRIGRLLITLFLMSKGLLYSPSLYVSYFLKKNQIEYYDRLTEVRNKGNYEQWITFFLEAINESAHDAIVSIDKLTALHSKNIGTIKKMGRSAKNTLKVFTYLEGNPVIDIQKTATALQVSYNTISNAVKRLTDAGIVKKIVAKNRNRIFAYSEYVGILKEGTE